MTKAQKADRAEAIAELLTMLKPGDTVYTIVDHVAKSGMSRRIRVLLLRADGPWYITRLVARACDWRMKDGALVVGGCGMDMGFHVVYELGATLWPNGTPEPHGRRNGEPDSAGGYALHQRWL